MKLQQQEGKIRELMQDLLHTCHQLGASEAEVSVAEDASLNVTVLNQEIENYTDSVDFSINLQVYLGKKTGSITVAKMPSSKAELQSLSSSALDIARYTQEDEANGLAEANLCNFQSEPADLCLYHPTDQSNSHFINNLMQLEAEVPSNLKSDGASFSSSQVQSYYANTNRIHHSRLSTLYETYLVLVGKGQEGLQNDYWFDLKRDYKQLIDNTSLVERAARRLKRRLNKGKASCGNYPVIFEANVAKSLLGYLLKAISGKALYRKLSFMTDSLGKKIMPAWATVEDNPFVPCGLSSTYFDSEGVATSKRKLIANGEVQGYLLNTYSGRKMNLKTTGNADGWHNIFLSSNTDQSLSQMAQNLKEGLIVLETIGSGFNLVTGDYSVGASGIWLKDGQESGFVENLTLNGNLKEMFLNLELVNQDTVPGSIQCGSMLIGGLNISTS